MSGVGLMKVETVYASTPSAATPVRLHAAWRAIEVPDNRRALLVVTVDESQWPAEFPYKRGDVLHVEITSRAHWIDRGQARLLRRRRNAAKKHVRLWLEVVDIEMVTTRPRPLRFQ